MEDFARKYPAWKALYQTRFNRIGDEARISDDIRLTILMDLLPPREREDVTRHRHFWKDADALDRHLLQLISDRARGAPTQLAHVEQDDDFDDLESHLDPKTGDTHTCSESSQRRERHTLSKLVASANPVLNASVIDADEVAIWLQIAMRRATLTEALLTHEGCRHDKKAMLKTTTTSESHSQPWSWSQVQVT